MSIYVVYHFPSSLPKQSQERAGQGEKRRVKKCGSAYMHIYIIENHAWENSYGYVCIYAYVSK